MRLPLLALLAAALATEAAALDFTRILSERAFREHVADRVLTDDLGGTILFAGNGGIGGARDKMAVSGGWVWTGEALCRRVRLDGIDTGADCLHLWIKGDAVVLQARQGRGAETWLTVAPRRGRAD